MSGGEDDVDGDNCVEEEESKMEVDPEKKKQPKKANVQFAPEAQAQEFEADDEAADAMIFDSKAYEMLHRAKVEWPCLSVDFLLPDRWAQPQTFTNSWFPTYTSKIRPEDSIVETFDDQ